MFLEDVETFGTVVDGVPSGFAGGVANYSGHNARVTQFCGFLNLMATQRRSLLTEETRLRNVLLQKRVVETNEKGEFVSAFAKDRDAYNLEKSALLAVCSSSNKEEIRDALLHEAMHGLFYVDSKFRAFCYAFWERECDESERTLWRRFLVNLRYNAENDEELAVNELQAYMATERKLFDASTKSSTDVKLLKSLQHKFSRAACKRDIFGSKAPPSVGASTKLVWIG